MFTATARVAPEKACLRPALLSLPMAGVLPEKMMAMTYRDQLRDPRWQKKRLEALEASGWECENCGDKTTTLHVHHKRYVKGRMAWEYEKEELSVLCEPCHEQEHEDRKVLEWMLSECGTGSISAVVGLVGGYLDALLLVDPGTASQAHEGREPYFEIGVAAACLECLDVDAWRQVVRDFVRDRPHSTPSMRAIVERWDDWDRQRKK